MKTTIEKRRELAELIALGGMGGHERMHRLAEATPDALADLNDALEEIHRQHGVKALITGHQCTCPYCEAYRAGKEGA